MQYMRNYFAIKNPLKPRLTKHAQQNDDNTILCLSSGLTWRRKILYFFKRFFGAEGQGGKEKIK